jgi:hypothetical protein
MWGTIGAYFGGMLTVLIIVGFLLVAFAWAAFRQWR